jgi:hypothetical protein
VLPNTSMSASLNEAPEKYDIIGSVSDEIIVTGSAIADANRERCGTHLQRRKQVEADDYPRSEPAAHT